MVLLLPISGPHRGISQRGGSRHNRTWRGPSTVNGNTSQGAEDALGAEQTAVKTSWPGPEYGALAPPATYLHRVGEVEFLGRATELLPSLVLRHGGHAAGRLGGKAWPEAAWPGPPYYLLPAAVADQYRGPPDQRGWCLLAPTSLFIGWPDGPWPIGSMDVVRNGAEPWEGGSGSWPGEVESRGIVGGSHSAPWSSGGASVPPPCRRGF